MTISAESQYINTYQSTGILVALTTRAGEAIKGRKITFTADMGTLKPNQAITNASGEVWVTFVASGWAGVSHITANSGGVSEMIEVNVALSTFQWIVIVFLCLLGLFGVVILVLRHRRKAVMMAKVNALRELQSASGEGLSALMPSVLDRAFKGEL